LLCDHTLALIFLPVLMQRLLLLLGAVLLAQGATAQTTPATGFATLPGSTTQYQLFRRDAAGRYAPRVLAPAGDAPYASRAGQVLLVYIEYRTDRDSVLMSSRKLRPEPVPVGLAPTTKPGSIEEAMGLLLPGDSAVFRFNADTAFTQMRQPVPPFIKRSGNALRLTVAAKELVTMEQMQARQQAMMAEQQRTAKARAAKQLTADDAKIQAYLASQENGRGHVVRHYQARHGPGA
jgi:FKBP-type peptidyl-prolyl cis-trans isomerase FkpA